MFPRVATVPAPVHAVSRHDVAPDARLPRSDEDQVGVRLAHGYRSDRGRGDLEVGDRRPVLPTVGGLPEPSAHGAKIRLVRSASHSRHGDGTATPVGTQVAPLVRCQEGRVEDHGFLLSKEWGGGEQEDAERGQRHREGREALQVHDSVSDEGGAAAASGTPGINPRPRPPQARPSSHLEITGRSRAIER